MSFMRPGNPNRRLRLFGTLVVLASIAFALKLVQLQVVDAPKINAVSIDNRSVHRVISAVRGSITDSAGNVLARSVYRYDINAAPVNVAPFDTTRNGREVTLTVEQQAQEIADILQVDVATIAEKIQGTSKYSQLAKDVDASVYRQLANTQIPWLFFDQKLARVYPNGAVAGNLLGFVGSDGTALAGVEREMNGCLAGIDGQETYERGTDGIRIPSSAVVSQRAQDGSSVILTINRDLQYFAQQELSHAVSKLRADWATAVVIEVKTGKVLVAAEAPSVDPNEPGLVAKNDRGSRIFQTSFEPGSTMKTITAATAVDIGAATPLTQVRAPQDLRLSWGGVISDSHAHPTQRLTLAGVLRDSSNTGMVRVAENIDRKVRYEYFKKFGFGVKTTVNFEGEARGILAKPEDWDGMTDKTTMFGQGISVTPIQMAMSYQAIANGGVRLSPTLIEGCVGTNGDITPMPVGEPVRVVSEATSKTVLAMLEKVVEKGGIGRTAGLPNWRIGGKSGTAQIDEGNGYGTRHAISFIGVGVIEDPQYVVAVTIFKPRTVSSSIGATPYFKSIMKQVLQTYSVLPSTTKSKPMAMEW